MKTPRRVPALLAALALAPLGNAQTVLGSLLYADAVGRGIRLTVVAAGLPGRMTIQPGEGEVDRLRKHVLALAGPERFSAAEVVVQVDAPPVAWTVDQRSGGAQVRAGEVIYWRYLPGQLLPVRFTFEGRPWSLQRADLPSRVFR